MSPIKRAVRFANRLRAIWKLCLSFRKRDWELADYPVVIRTQEPDPASAYHASRFKLNRYVASIVDWHLTGSGDSQEEALQNLRGTFAAVKLKKEETGEPLPRPGTHVPIEVASQERVNAHPELADDFIRRVLELEWAWISDESCLWDFHPDETDDAYYAKIKEVYGVDISDIQYGNLSEILERIAAAQKPA
jgi:predicted RNase H-like HicB family nuclease